MPKALPNLKRKQKMLYDKDAKPEALIAQGQLFQEAGWLNDAIAFFDKAGYEEGLQLLRQTARADGDVFLLRRILKCLDLEAEPEEWNELADRALELGKLQFAREGYRMANNRKALDRIEDQINPPEPEPEAAEQHGE